MSAIRRLAAAAMAATPLLLAGCIVVPIGWFTDNPYAPDKLAPLQAPGADRALVRQTFGAPTYTRENQRYWFYTHSRETVGIIAGTTSTVLTDDDWLLVEFGPHDQVVLAETTDFKKCTSNGICLSGSEIYADPAKGPRHDTQPQTGACGIYLYLEPLPWPLFAGQVRYAVDGQPVGVVSSHSYLYLTHPSGPVRIAAYDLEITAACESGQWLYVRAVKKTDWSWQTGEDLAPVPAAQGQANIQTRYPALRD